MASLKSAAKQLQGSSSKFKTPKGAAGYDNARENIDPHLRTGALTSKEGTIQGTPTNAKDITNKEYVDAKEIESLPTSLTAGSVVFSDGSNLSQDNSNLFFDDTNKRIGIGTNSPTTPLDIQDDSSVTTPTLGFHCTDTGVPDNQVIGKLVFYSADGSGGLSSTSERASIQIYATGGFGSKHNMSFKTRSAGTYSEKLLLSDDGDVGIGVADPLYKLHVAGHIKTDTNIIADNDIIMNTNATTIQWKNSAGGQDEVFEYNASDNNIYGFGVAAGNSVRFSPGGGAKLTIEGGGNVGIATTSPDTKLQVVGDLKVGDDNTNYVTVGTTGDVSFTGSAGFYPRRISQAAIPASGTGATQVDTGELMMWEDSDDNTVWLVYNDTVSGVVSIKLE